MKRRPPYRNGKVHVLDTLCKTCIFRPGNLMDLHEGRVEDMVHRATCNDSAIICHSTLGKDEAVCRGFFEKHATAPLQIAQRQDRIIFVPADQYTK